MKRIIEDTEATGFEAMLGERVIILCSVYHYAGRLGGVSDDHVELEDGGIVYETGDWGADKWSDFQAMPGPVRVMKSHIEAWGPGK